MGNGGGTIKSENRTRTCLFEEFNRSRIDQVKVETSLQAEHKCTEIYKVT